MRSVVLIVIVALGTPAIVSALEVPSIMVSIDHVVRVGDLASGGQ